MEAAATPQPAPIPRDTPSMHDLVMQDLVPGTERLVAEDLEARKQFGLTKYGTILQAFNGRDALMDAYQETLDQLVYLKQVITEHPSDAFLPAAYSKALQVAVFLRRRIEVRNA